MATEAQRLITVSISKIAMSRSNRGGINLHKNLLVASVLHKARTAYMLENIQSRLVNKISQNNNSSPGVGTDGSPVSHAKTSEHMVVCESPGKRSGGAPEVPRVPVQSCPASDKENSPPNNNGQQSEPKCNNVTENNGPCAESMDVTNTNCSDTKNNNKTEAESATKKCVRCIKRRSSGPLEVCSVLPKKPRLDYENESESDSSENENSQSRSENCVESGPSPQISNLVSIFNTGFSGLCVQDSNTLSQKQYSGRYENTVLSCANEVKENSLDNSMSSVIALTV